MGEGEENDAHHHSIFNNTTYFEENDETGRPSSCDEVEDEDDDGNLWAPELLHSQSQDFSFPAFQNDVQGDVEDRDTEVEEAARSLLSYGEDTGGLLRSDVVGRGQRRMHASSRGRGDRGGRKGLPLRGRKSPIAPVKRDGGRAARAKARAAARAGRAAISSGSEALAAATSGSPDAAAAGTSISAARPAGPEATAGPSQRSLQAAPAFPQHSGQFTEDMPEFFTTASSESDVDGLEDGDDGDGDP
jgi:hypothetical protein